MWDFSVIIYYVTFKSVCSKTNLQAFIISFWQTQKQAFVLAFSEICKDFFFFTCSLSALGCSPENLSWVTAVLCPQVNISLPDLSAFLPWPLETTIDAILLMEILHLLNNVLFFSAWSPGNHESMAVWVSLAMTCKRDLHFLPFCECRISLYTASSRFIHEVACVRLLFSLHVSSSHSCALGGLLMDA